MGGEAKRRRIKVALYGYGTVGSAVVHFLISQATVLREKSGTQIALAYIIDRDPASIDIKRSTITRSDDHDLPLRDPDVDVIVELIGGVKAAYTLCKKAIRAGKHIVTANKALIAEHGPELCAAAHARGVCIAFEASCGGAIPILRVLYGGLISNRIDALYAIINGTCNYILTKMTNDQMEYADALKEAQRLGFAEADPTLDVKGGDSAHKLAIMTALAYGYRVSYRDVDTVGIDKIELDDIEYGKRLDLHMKLIAMSIRQKDALITVVRPTFLSASHPLRRVNGAYNAVSVYGDASGHTLFYGQGAGGGPTASAVVSDIIGVSSGEIPTAFTHYSNWPDTSRTPKIGSSSALEQRYYIRLVVKDQPGMLGHITNALGAERLNISSVHQYPSGQRGNSSVRKVARMDVIVTLHTANGARVLSAVTRLRAIAVRVYYIPILDEREENA